MDTIAFQKFLNPDNSKKVSNIESMKVEEDRLSENVDVRTVATDAPSVAESKIKETSEKPSKKHHAKLRQKTPATVVTGSDSDSGSDSGSEESNSDSEDSVISSMSTNRKNQAANEKFSNINDVRREFMNKIQRFKTMGYKVDIRGDESADELSMIFDGLKYEQRFKANIRFFRLIIRFFGWIIEEVTVRIGFSSLKGFGTHIGTQITDFDEFYEDMTEPIYQKQESGEYIKIEKSNIFSYVASRPEINLLTRFGTTAIAYSAANKVETLAELMAD